MYYNNFKNTINKSSDQNRIKHYLITIIPNIYAEKNYTRWRNFSFIYTSSNRLEHRIQLYKYSCFQPLSL